LQTSNEAEEVRFVKEFIVQSLCAFSCLQYSDTVGSVDCL